MEETMIINHNMPSMFASRTLKFNDQAVFKDMEKLSSGLRINRAGDDASNLAVSEKMRSQIRGLIQAEKNTENGVSFIQTAEGYLQESQDVLQRMRELAIQSSNGIYSAEDRLYIQVEISQLVDELDRVASHAQFNGMNMLTGRFANDTYGGIKTGSMWFHIGPNMDQRKQVYIGTMTAKGLGMRDVSSGKFISYSTLDGSNMAIGTIDQAMKKINKQRADLGAFQNRFEMAEKGILCGAENMQAAESIIRDANMANEMVNYTKDNILVQSSTAMLAQANVRTQSILRLLNG
jgi:flagellin